MPTAALGHGPGDTYGFLMDYYLTLCEEDRNSTRLSTLRDVLHMTFVRDFGLVNVRYHRCTGVK